MFWYSCKQSLPTAIYANFIFNLRNKETSCNFIVKDTKTIDDKFIYSPITIKLFKNILKLKVEKMDATSFRTNQLKFYKDKF